MDTANLDGISVLVVEDEGIQARDLQLALEDAGASVIGPVGHVEDAWDVIEVPHLDCAILDVSLHGEMIYPVADVLLERDVPVIFVTAYSAEHLPKRYANLPVFRKPVSLAPLTHRIEKELSEARADGH